MDALKGFPDFDTKLMTEKGEAVCRKQDIFKGLMSFAYIGNFGAWHVIKVAQVQEIIAQNKQKIKVSGLEDFAIEVEKIAVEKTFQNAMGQDSLTRFDQPKKSNKKPNKNRKPAAVIQANPNKPVQKIVPNASAIKPNTNGPKIRNEKNDNKN